VERGGQFIPDDLNPTGLTAPGGDFNDPNLTDVDIARAYTKAGQRGTLRGTASGPTQRMRNAAIDIVRGNPNITKSELADELGDNFPSVSDRNFGDIGLIKKAAKARASREKEMARRKANVQAKAMQKGNARRGRLGIGSIGLQQFSAPMATYDPPTTNPSQPLATPMEDNRTPTTNPSQPVTAPPITMTTRMPQIGGPNPNQLPEAVRQAAQMTINAATVTLNAQNVNFGNNVVPNQKANQESIQQLRNQPANANAPNMQASMAAMTTFGDKLAQTVQQLNNTTIKIESTNIGPIDVNVNGVEILNTAKTAFMQEFIPVLKQEIASAIQGSANSIDGPTSVGGTNGTMIA
jgi:hypothetical protein